MVHPRTENLILNTLMATVTTIPPCSGSSNNGNQSKIQHEIYVFGTIAHQSLQYAYNDSVYEHWMSEETNTTWISIHQIT